MVKADYVSLWSIKQEFYQPRLLSSLLTPTGRGGSVVIRDYVRALKWLTALESAMHSLGHPITKGTCSQVGSLQDLCSMLHPSDKFRLGLDMCLCGTLSSLPDARQTEILESSSWLATEKIRGIRALLLSYAAPGRGSRFSLYSRFLSDDCGLIDWGPKLWQQHNFGQGVTAVDVEICYPHSMDDFKTLFEGAENLASTSTGVAEYVLSLPENQALGIQSQFYAKYQRHMFSLMVICPIFYEKVNYLKQPLRAGWDVYTQVVSHLRSAGLNAFEINRCFGGKFEKVSFLDSILNRGGEGVVLHNGDAFYDITGSRDSNVMVKIKNRVGGPAKRIMDDTFDAFITGGSGAASSILRLELSIICENEDGYQHRQVLGFLPISGDLSLQATILDGGVPRLNPDFMDKVVEVQARALDNNFHLIDPTLVRLRHDKAASDCVYTATYLRSLPRG